MNVIPYMFLIVEMSCDQVVPITIRKLSQRGWRVMQTFNLHLTISDQQGCPCPHQASDPCDCQMRVLLIFDNQNEPTPLFVFGSSGRTILSFENSSSDQVENDMMDLVRLALDYPVTQSNFS